MVKTTFQNKTWREGILLYAPLFLWIGVIFYLSSSNGSMSQTSRFVRPFLEWLFPLATEETLQIYHGYVRKFAHFFEYAMLAFFASRAFRLSGRMLWAIFALLVVVLVASIDEFNQSFNSLRTGSIYDVLLDFSGGLTMVLLLLIGNKWMTK